MIKLSFQPKQVTKKLLSNLNERGQDVLVKRYGLDAKNTSKATLEAIGKKYNITRERVRQIEEHSLAAIRKSDSYKDVVKYFEELHGVINDIGGIVSEQDLLEEISKTESVQNHVHFMLVVGNPFFKKKEDDHFAHRWYLNEELAEQVENSIKKLYESLSDEDIIPENEIIQNFLLHISNLSENYKNEEVIKRWLRLSKKIASNPLGEWGRVESSNINIKGIRDYAYLVIRKHGSPIHFREVADLINKLFGKRAHVATCHNELIKDPRFVLVGRGLYALTDWGYSNGIVKDVIKDVILKHGPMKKEDIIQKVLKERYVKENTILVNLQNSGEFIKDETGIYHIA
jgi:hypothetical protein